MATAVSAPLSPHLLASLLEKTQSQNGRAKGYLCKHVKKPLYQVFQTSKENKAISRQSYKPLALRDIVQMGRQLKKTWGENPKAAHTTARILLQMSKAKTLKEKKRCLLIQLIHLICDCFKNLFNHLGFHRSTTVAKTLSKELARIPSTEIPPRIPPSEEGEETTVTPLHPEAQEQHEEFSLEWQLKQMAEKEAAKKTQAVEKKEEPVKAKELILDWEKEGFVKRQAKGFTIPETKQMRFDEYVRYVDASIANPRSKELGPFLKNLIFQEIQYPAENPQNSTISVFGLMRSVSQVEWFDPKTQKTYVDLSDPKALQVLTDIILYARPNITEKLFTWLTEYKTFSPECLKTALQALLNRPGDTKISFVTELLKFYKKNGWNSTRLLESDPIIMQAMGYQFAVLHNESSTEHLLKWYLNLPLFGYESCLCLIDSYVKRGRSFQTGCDNRDLVIDRFNQNPEWKEKLQKTDPELHHILYYQPSEEEKAQQAAEAAAARLPPHSAQGRENAKAARMQLKQKGSALLTRVDSSNSIVGAKKKGKFQNYTASIRVRAEGKALALEKTTISSIFQDLNSDPDFVNPRDATNSVKGLMHAVAQCKIVDLQDPESPVDYADLNDRKTLLVLTDVINHAEIKLLDSVWNWLEKNPTFKMEAIKACFQGCINRYAINSSDISFLLKTLKKYKNLFQSKNNLIADIEKWIKEEHCSFQSISAKITKKYKDLIDWSFDSDAALPESIQGNTPLLQFINNVLEFTKSGNLKAAELGALKNLVSLLNLISQQPDLGLSPQSPLFANSVAIILAKATKDRFTEELIEWYAALPDFSYENCVDILDSFSKSGRVFDLSLKELSILYQVINTKADWKARLKEEKSELYMLLFS